jgi:hypothetical protein
MCAPLRAWLALVVLLAAPARVLPQPPPACITPALSAENNTQEPTLAGGPAPPAQQSPLRRREYA